MTSLQLELDEYQHFRRGLSCAKIERADYQRRRRLRQQLLNFNRLLWTYQHSMVMQLAFEQQQLTEAERNIIGKHGFRPFHP